VILVNEGVHSGARFLGAVASVRDRGARKVVVAAPAGRTEATWQLHEAADIVVIPHRPTQYKGIDHFYQEYTPLSDDVVLSIVKRWTTSRPDEDAGLRTILLKVAGTLKQQLACELDLPGQLQRGSGPHPATIFVHGFESDGRSPRNVPISRRLAKRGIIGVRMNLTGHGLSEGTVEQATSVQALQDLHAVFQAVQHLKEVDPNRIGIIGSGEGALIALHYAARFPAIVKALVIRGPVFGNESEAAHLVTAPTLLIHAEHDTALADCMNLLDRELLVTHEVLRIPESNRMFGDPISRELMVNASVQWMADHLAAIPPSEDRSPPQIEIARTQQAQEASV
jgi:pimeloyl-ACP methyl ester carboxylesterase